MRPGNVGENKNAAIEHNGLHDDDSSASLAALTPLTEQSNGGQFHPQIDVHRKVVHTIKSWIFDTFFSLSHAPHHQVDTSPPHLLASLLPSSSSSSSSTTAVSDTGETLDRSRFFARFFALETIARVPYFSYLSVLHFYETTGKWRAASYLVTHFAQTYNELHHLLIMESLGGHTRFLDRFLAQHIAFGYYWLVVLLYLIDPSSAYSLNQAVEEEAWQTYQQFIEQHAEYLQSHPAPPIAIQYYTGETDDVLCAVEANDEESLRREFSLPPLDCATVVTAAGSKAMYMFDIMHTNRIKNNSPVLADTDNDDGFIENNENQYSQRRPSMKTLYDCFVAIRDDELEHAHTMATLSREFLQHKSFDHFP
jgi:hypothetical protein